MSRCQCGKRLYRKVEEARTVAAKLDHRVYDCPTAKGCHTTRMDSKRYVKSLGRYMKGGTTRA